MKNSNLAILHSYLLFEKLSEYVTVNLYTPDGRPSKDIQNAGEEDVELPATSTVVIGVNKVLPGAAEKHEEEAATAGNSTQ